MGTLLASLPLAAFLEWWQWLLIVVIIGLIVFLKIYRSRQQ